MPNLPENRGAAFFRLEGALTPWPAWRGAQWLANRAPSVRRRLFGGALTLLSAGRAFHPRLGSGLQSSRSQWQALEGFTRDRLEILAEDFAREELLPTVSEPARRLLREAEERGRVLVLIAETASVIARPFARALGIEHVISNQLAIESDRATGELLPPFVGPELAPKRLLSITDSLGLSLEASAAYGSSSADRLLLAAVGSPCALHPDAELARLARDFDWPIVGPQRTALTLLSAFAETVLPDTNPETMPTDTMKAPR